MELTADIRRGWGGGWVCSAESITNVSSEDQGCIPQRQGHRAGKFRAKKEIPIPGGMEAKGYEGLARRRGLPNPL